MKKDLSDYNSLKNQQNQIKKYDKYKKPLKPKPSAQFKYYDYLTNQQPQLDYVNYLSNTQISNDKKNVEKQLENAVMLKDKFTANLEAQKKQIELEKQQRQERQKEVFAQDLFDAKKNEQRIKEEEKRIKAAPTAATTLQSAIRNRMAKRERDFLDRAKDKEFIANQAGEIIKRRIEPKYKEIFAANEKYSKDYIKKEFADKQLAKFQEEARKIKEAKKIENAQKYVKENPIDKLMAEIEAKPKAKQPQQQLTLYKGDNRPRLPRKK